ncbi:SDR family NAD(P)-dependent oxidoreductase [Dactylosporangium sp. AC04546]|uniref:SDR family NAD(P)-dependent oxidoreductase n=1 Tax=Dactylosporangium sp. AC04546 TaxID=2862460 RepID=UPI001EDE3155|nr:SDR family NAD(P)-dependent oxidoreductase [Dactylosporangium sp. AC04546]WVK88820.1 SDR family NAD(P)-dependent oxidoreductase [Dactylosporangium sp. AC04546]
MRIAGRVALVTGASSGIGWAAALRLAGAGARLVLHGRDRRRLSALAGRTGGFPVPGDLAEPAEASRLAAEAERLTGGVDILVNNAGVGWAGPFGGMAPSDIERLVTVNLVAPMRLTRALLPAMCARRDGCVMFVTSIAGRTGVAGEAVYAATKAGLDSFAESLRLEARGSGVGIGVLVPGVVQTEFFQRRGRPYERRSPRPLPVDRVADLLVDTIATGSAERYTPGWLRLPVAVRGAAPGLYRWLAGRFG